MRIKAWFESWWWPAKIKWLERQLKQSDKTLDGMAQTIGRIVKENDYSLQETKRMREKWLTATRELECLKEQAVQQHRERQQYVVQRDEARGLVVALSRAGETDVNLPEWANHPYYTGSPS